MTTALDKLKAHKKQQQLQTKEQGETKVANSPEVSTTGSGSILQGKLAGLRNKAAKSSVTNPAVAALMREKQDLKAATEKKKIEDALEIPEDIYTLNDSIYEIEGFKAEQLSKTLASVYRAISLDQPDLPSLLELINTNLRQYEELSFLLTPEQLGLYYDGLMKAKGVNIKTSKPKATAAKIAQQVANDGGLDLGSL